MRPAERDALAARNRALADAFHAAPFKHRVRRAALGALSRVPIQPLTPHQPERLLLIRPDHLGDVLLTTPAIRALRAAYPAAELHALVGGWSAEVLAHFDAVDHVLTLPFPGFSRTPKLNWRSPYALAWRTARGLRRLGYSTAFIFRPDHWWGALIAHLAGIPRVIGHAQPDAAPFLTEAVPLTGGHAVEQSLRLVERCTGQPVRDPVYRFDVDSADRAWVDGYLSEWGLSPAQPIIALHPGAGTWVKRWDEDRWAFVADTLAAQLEGAVVFTGSERELPLVKRIVAHMQQPACIMAGDTRVGALAALYQRARLVLGPDSGPLHLACAVGTPTVTLFGPADPVEFGPWRPAHLPADRHAVLTSDIACRPCRILDWTGDDAANHPCVREIAAGRVLEAARRVLSTEKSAD